jgi:exosome complex RNA-binding protein Rrp42 (RNase PH superfamily)
MYTVIVDVKVVNSMGEVVDAEGYADMGSPHHTHRPLKSEQRFVTFEDIAKAQKAMNGVQGLVKAAKELP